MLHDLHWCNLQAEEQTTNRRFATTRISVTVSPANNFAPTLTTNTIGFTGYVQENSEVGTMVTNKARDQVLKLTILDQDVVSASCSQLQPYVLLDLHGRPQMFLTRSGSFSISVCVSDCRGFSRNL